jgi:hypothetical protein
METIYEIIKEHWILTGIVTGLVAGLFLTFLAATIGSMLKELDDKK